MPTATAGGRLEFDFGTCDLEAAASGIEADRRRRGFRPARDTQGRRCTSLDSFGSNDQLVVTWTPGA